MKKLALFLCMTLLASCMLPFAVGAAETIPVEYEVLEKQPERTVGKDCYEVLENRSFELMESETKMYDWGFTSYKGAANTPFGCDIGKVSKDAHTGNQAVWVSTEDATKHVHLLGGAVIRAGQTYEFSVWHKKLDNTVTTKVQILFTGYKDGISQSYKRATLSMKDVTVANGWVKKALRFKAPEYSTNATISMQLNGPGAALWDDVSLLCITNEMPKQNMPDVKPSLKDIGFKDGDMENSVVGKAPSAEFGWSTLGDVTVTDKYAHSGTKSVNFRILPGSTQDAILQTTVTGLEEGATYQVSTWVMQPGERKVDFGYWFYYSSLEDRYDHSDVSTQVGHEKPRFSINTNLNWTQYVTEVTPPAGAKSALIYFRFRVGPGDFYVDDLSMYMVKVPNAVKADTDETIYYTEWETGEAVATPYVLADPANSKVEFSFIGLDGKPTHRETFADLTTEKKYIFRTEWMKEKGQEYKIGMKVYGPEGEVLQEQTFPIYRYDRPTYLGADGIFRKNGKEYNIVVGNGITATSLSQKPEEGGVTVVQIIASDRSPLTLSEKMDLAYKQGLLVLVNLYSGTKNGGEASRLPFTKNTVESVKDHPALFGYKVQDEPWQKGNSAEELTLAYKTIRDLDPNHVVYLLDSVTTAFPWLFRYCDYLDIDNYAGGNKDTSRHLSECMDLAMEASKGRKPFGLVEQASKYNGYLPTMDEMRHMAYLTFFAGGAGYSFHTLGNDGELEYNFIDGPEWKEIVEKWGPWERDFMFDVFVNGKYGLLNYNKTNDIQWGTFTDGKDIYAILLNRDENKSFKAEIPLADGAGKLKVDAFTAETMTGEKKTLSGNGTLSVDLAPFEAVVWKITPSAPIDASLAKATTYRDMLPYSWAYNAVATLEEKGIINEIADNWYGPGKNITRGDYAMFLVRALGLSVAPGENFADVAETAEYAKELAIGKAAGILQGVGDNKFNPEAEITRQDMMTMTSRALKLAGSANLGTFSDADSIADYARAHVAAMVDKGLVKGNADGTINPKGNTTRAEAAMIMFRLLEA